MLEVVGFILNSSSPSGPSVDGVLKNICEWVAVVLNGFWKILADFLKTKSRGKNEKNKTTSEYLGDAVLLEIVN